LSLKVIPWANNDIKPERDFLSVFIITHLKLVLLFIQPFGAN
jgi:hypothetical protein